MYTPRPYVTPLHPFPLPLSPPILCNRERKYNRKEEADEYTNVTISKAELEALLASINEDGVAVLDSARFARPAPIAPSVPVPPQNATHGPIPYTPLSAAVTRPSMFDERKVRVALGIGSGGCEGVVDRSLTRLLQRGACSPSVRARAHTHTHTHTPRSVRNCPRWV